MRNKRSQKGAAMIEFALCFVLALSLLYGAMEFARIVYSRNILSGATREAARFAIVHGNRSGSPADQAAIRTQLTKWALGLDPAAIVVNATWSPSNAPGNVVRVDASYTITPFTRLIIGTPMTVASRSEMVISQ